LIGDIIFIIDEKPHERFKRDGNDLHYTAKVGLAQALTGVVISIQTLDDRNLNFNFTDVIKYVDECFSMITNTKFKS
jgi:DnaJ-class molecular chaperone